MQRILQGLQRLAVPVAWLALLAAVAALSLLAAAGPGFRLEWWELGTGFSMMRWGAWLGMGAAVLGLAAGAALLWLGPRRAALYAALAVLIGAMTAVVPYNWREQARSVPPIHDITTDTDNPPPFVAIAPLREDAPNPVEYPGEETAQAQREAYPDIRPVWTEHGPEAVFSAALNVANRLGWELVESDAEDGRIEATDTTRWFGFKDDVVIRVRPADGGSRIDVRSLSRVGRGDAGTNAKRIRAYLDALKVG
jgi:uncharacterized protein (DUF1499 family)